MVLHEIAIMAVASVAYLAIPGATVIFIVNEVMLQGWRAVTPLVLGATLANVAYLLAAVVGVAALAAASPATLALLQYGGVAFLLWLSWKTWRDVPSGKEVDAVTAVERHSFAQMHVRALGVNVMNPKKLIFFVGILPHVATPAMMHGQNLAIVVILFTLLSLLVYSTYAVSAHLFSSKLLNARTRRRMQKIGAGLLFSIAAALGVMAAS
ncbi:MAG: LysE family translocator [Rhodospirillales bacterium]